MQSPATLERSLADYEALTDPVQWRRLESLGDSLAGARVLHVNSTAAGGGVAELLRSLVPLFVDVGVGADWAVMDADEAFYEVTKAFHNGLQGEAVALTDEMRATYRRVTERNAAAVDESYDVVVLHDPQTLGMAGHLADAHPDARLVWRCHIDLTDADGAVREFLAPFVRRVDHAVFTRRSYSEPLDVVPSTVIHPAIDPLADKNRALSDAEAAAARERLDGVPLGEAPVVTQVSRFDPWKDPVGVVEAVRTVRERHPDAHLVLAGGMADDDPEGAAVYRRVADAADDDPHVHLLTDEPDETINLLQRDSDVVVQKSVREGFGLVVAEALWKRTPVVATDVGGIPLQVDDGGSGYLVDSGDDAAFARRIADLLDDPERRRRMGRRGRETVRERFLLPRQLLDWATLLDELL